jgi:hypothetical protein
LTNDAPAVKGKTRGRHTIWEGESQQGTGSIGKLTNQGGPDEVANCGNDAFERLPPQAVTREFPPAALPPRP